MLSYLLVILFTSWFLNVSSYPMLGSFNNLDLSIQVNAQLANAIVKFSLNQLNQQNQKNFTVTKIRSALFQIVAGLNVKVSTLKKKSHRKIGGEYKSQIFQLNTYSE